MAAAVLGSDGRPLASLSISAPIDRMPMPTQSAYGEMVQDAARQIEQILGFHQRAAPDDVRLSF